MGQTKQKWTEEPWSVRTTGTLYHSPWIAQVKPKGSKREHDPIVDMEFDTDNDWADAYRAVACVNALAGEPDPAKFVAEAKKLKKQVCDSVAHLGELSKRADRAEEQRDALFEALRELREILETAGIEMKGDLPSFVRYEAACQKGAAAIAKAQEKS